MFRILTADNEKSYRRSLGQLLKKNGYYILWASGTEEILKTLESEYVDMLILGEINGDMTPAKLVAGLRDTYPDMVILMLAKEGDAESLKTAYLAGTDEYLPKSVDDEELILRIRALLRRAGRCYDKRLRLGEVVLDSSSMTVSRGDERYTLPRKEFLLLYKLLSYPGNIFTRTQLMDEIWGLSSETAPSTLNVHINRLRNKFRDYPEFELKAVRGMGYKAEVNI